MRILFSAYGSGLGNNGGSLSLINMAIKFREFGHESYILSHMDSAFTWFHIPNDLNVIVPGNPKKWPKCDVIIATACNTWQKVIDYSYTKRKFYWIRGIERWKQSDAELIEGYKSGLVLMANSKWQCKYIEQVTGIVPHLVYSGLSFKKLQQAYNSAKEIKYDRFTVGALYSSKKHKRWDLVETLMNDFYKYKYLAFGAEDKKDGLGKLSIYVKNASMINKMRVMKSCDIWFAPTELDGCHRVPMEACIAGATVVCNAAEEGGMRDYAIHKETALTWYTYPGARECVKELVGDFVLRRKLNQNMRILLADRIGSVADNAVKMLKIFC